jgi:hypothetical protein
VNIELYIEDFGACFNLDTNFKEIK